MNAAKVFQLAIAAIMVLVAISLLPKFILWFAAVAVVTEALGMGFVTGWIEKAGFKVK